MHKEKNIESRAKLVGKLLEKDSLHEFDNKSCSTNTNDSSDGNSNGILAFPLGY